MKKTNFTKLAALCLMLCSLFGLQTVQAQCPAGQTQVNVAMSNETFDGENGWILWDATAGVSLACANSSLNQWADGTSVDVCATDGNELELYTYESFGDGWQGGILTVTSNEDGSVNGCNAQNLALAEWDDATAAGYPDDNDMTNGTGDGGINCNDPFDTGTNTMPDSGPIVPTPAMSFSVACIQCMVTCPADALLPSDAGVCGAEVTLAAATATADCGAGAVITNDYNGGGADASGFYPVGTTTVTFTTFDANGSPASCSMTVTVLDAEGPTLDCPSNEVIHLDGGDCDKGYSFEVGATDQCPSAPVALEGPFCDPCLDPSGGSALACAPFAQNSIIQSIATGGLAGEITQVCYNQETFGQEPLATFNFYTNDGSGVIPWDDGAGTFDALLLGSEMYQTSNADNGACVCVDLVTPIPVTSATTAIYIEVFTPGTTLNSRIVQTPATCNGASATGTDTYIAAPACGIAPPATFASVGFVLDAGYTLTITPAEIVAQEDPNAPAGYNEFESGDNLPVGEHCFQYEATDGAGNQSICSWCVTVEEYSDPISQLSCNSNLNHGVNLDCEFVITPDIILEGGPYACYDNYIVTIAGVTPASAVVGNGTNAVTIKASQLDGWAGMAGPYDIQVTDPATGISCWGSGHMFEDKVAPIIECPAEVTIGCDDDAVEGTPFQGEAAASIEGPDAVGISWGDGETGAVGEATFTIAAAPGATLDDLSLSVDLDHSWMGDVDINLTSPSGTTVSILDGACATQDNASATFGSTGGPNPCAASTSPAGHENCNEPGYYLANATVSGDIAIDLSALLGEDPNGDWTVSFVDNVGGDGGCVQNLGLSVAYSATVPGPIITENCGAYELETTDVVTNFDCFSSDISQRIERTYLVTDSKGNTASCTQIINRGFATPEDIVFPPNYDNLDEPAFDCSNANTDVSNTGEPTGGCETINFTHEDIQIDICEGSYKILRTWTVIDWCTGEIITHPQVIKVLDTTGPALTCPADKEVSTNNSSCDATVLILGSEIGLTDDCSSAALTGATITAGTISPSGNNWVVTGLPIGTHTVTLSAEDDCGNTSECSFTITVTDQIAPTAICETFHTVALSSGNITQVAASVFDDGSTDNCGPVTMDVRRMDSCIDFDWTTNGAGIDESPNGLVNNADRGTGNPNSQTTGWYPAVPFACCDAGTEVMVAFRVTDEAGNRNTCMVTVEIQDKIDGVIECPDNQDFECSIDILSISDIALAGVSATDNGGLPTYYSDGTSAYEFVGYYADAFDNCAANVFILDRGGINSCGESYLTNPNFPGDARRYHAIYPATVPVADVPTSFSQLISGADDFCTQLLGVQNPNDFGLNDINFPNDVTVTCPVDPSNTGAPTVNEDACSNVAITQEPDLIVPLNDDTACYKILRNWIIIDWCQYDGNGAGYWEHEQVIKVNDQEAPTLDSGCDYESFDITTDNDGNFNNGCRGPVSLSATGSDNCSTDLIFSYEVRTASGSFVASGNGSSYNGNLELGSYTIEWTLTDGCGNYVQCIKPFDVLDNTPPLVYADFGLEVNLSQGYAEIWANDFDEGSSDECSGICDMRIASPSQGPGQTAPPTTTSVSFDCNDLGNNTVDFWVKDCANNWAYVSTFVIIQDNADYCTDPQSSVSTISGTISTELGDNVEDVTVDLTGNAPGMDDSYVTSNDGTFAFNNLPNSYNYTTTPSNDLNHLNGVSTYDLVLISKHILSIESLDSPYKMIAADINKSGSITTFDMVELRKLILFINTEFTSNTSWRFVDANYVFPDVTDPFSTIFPEVNSINGLTTDEIANFVGVKIGDVNGSAIPNNLVGGDDRNTVGDVVFNVADQNMVAGQEYTVDFTAKDFANVMGYQFTLAFDTDAVEFVDVNAGDLAGMDASNFGLSMINEGVITTSWNASEAAKLNNNDVVFSVTFTANTAAQLSDVMNISSRYTVAEAYNAELELMNVAVEYTQDGEVAAAGFDLFQNQPNPFKDVTTISFTLPEATAATLTVYDVSGRVLRSIEGDYAKGYNEVTINRSDLSGSGVLYYTLDTATDSATKKMIIVD